MLKTMRRNVKALKPTLWIIIATFIIAIFAIWGGAGRLGESDNAGTLVTIGHERVSSDTYFQTLRQRLEAMKREYPQLDRGLIQQLNVPQQVLQQIVEQSLLLQISRDMKIGAGDEEVRARIVSYPVFQKDGRFIGFEEYKQVLDWNRIPLTQFESGLKKEIADHQGRPAAHGRGRGLGRRGLGELPEAERIGEDRISRRRDRQDRGRRTARTPPRVQAAFEKDKARYRIPETRTADYVFFRTDDLKKDVKTDPAEIETYYRDNISQFRDPEKIRVSRVWLPFTPARTRPSSWPRPKAFRSRPRRARTSPSWPGSIPRTTRPRTAGTGAFPPGLRSPPGRPRRSGSSRRAACPASSRSTAGAAVLKVTEKTAEVTRPLDRGPGHGQGHPRGPEGPRAGRRKGRPHREGRPEAEEPGCRRPEGGAEDQDLPAPSSRGTPSRSSTRPAPSARRSSA